MMQQVQINDEQCLRFMTEFNSAKEVLMLLKGYVIGYLGISLRNYKMEELVKTIDFYEDWIESGTISRQNVIGVFLTSVKKLNSFHNRNSNQEEEHKTIQDFRSNVQQFVGRIMENDQYFNTPQVYNPKEDILMSLNFTENQCSICTENMDPEQVIILDCTHVYHIQCLYEHVRNSIESGQVFVKCPSQYCGIELGQHEIINFLTPELNKKQQDYMMNQYVEKNGQSISWCPTPDCNFLFQYDSSITDFSCRNCHRKYCLKCRCDFHENMTCTEYREFKGMNPQDQSFVNFARGARFKQCPRCRFWVERNTGCPSMKCRCSQQFCYDCGGVTCPHGICSKNVNNTVVQSRRRF